MNNIKKAAQLIKEFRIKKDYTYFELKGIAEKYGYIVHEWYQNYEKDRLLFEKLDCLELSHTSEAFTLRSETKKIIFVEKILTEKEKSIALMHELIHIALGHLTPGKKISVLEEKQTTDIHHIIDVLLKLRAYIVIPRKEKAVLCNE